MKKRILLAVYAIACSFIDANSQIRWQYQSTANGKIPLHWETKQQTSSLIVDFNNDGVNDWVIGCRQRPPSIIGLIWTARGFKKYIIEKDFLTVEAGGTSYDIDGDGDQDLVFGGDYESNQMWWWGNPYPNLSPTISWERHIIKNSGKTQYHDQVFGDFKRTGKAQLAFWNQQSNTLFIADIPKDPKNDKEWKREVVFSGNAGQQNAWYAEGVAAADVDGDGNLDIFAAEMAKWTEERKDPDNPKAEAFIFFGDGRGHFRKEIFKTGFGFHETRPADIDGDGDIDILSKPYNWETPRLDIWLQNGTGKRIPPINEALKNKTGLELYSLRDLLGKDLPSTLHTIRAMGIKAVEISDFFGWKPATFKSELDEAGLTPTSIVFPYQLFRDSLQTIIKRCQLFGVHYTGVGWLPHDDSFTREDALNAAEMFNE